MSRPPLFPALEASSAALSLEPGARLTFGIDSLDARLGGGLAEAALHEIYGTGEGDESAATGFALLLAQRCVRTGPLVWLREDKVRMNGRLYGLGLAELGFDPDRLLLVQAPDTLSVLRAGVEAVACSAVGIVVIEPWGKATALDLTASRRLALAAARSGVLTLLLRHGDAVPSAAQSRWGVKAAPSPMLLAEAPGAPAFDVSLLRHRSGIAGFETRLEWNRDRRVFCLASGAALPWVAPALAVERAGKPRAGASPRRRAA